MTRTDASDPRGTEANLDIRLMEPADRALVEMILADATPEATSEAASVIVAEHEQAEGSAIFIVSLNGLPVASHILAPAQMSIEMPLIAVRKEMRRKGIGAIVMQDALRRAGQRPLVLETPEAVLPFFTSMGFKKFGRRKGPNGEPRFRVGWHSPGQRTPTGGEAQDTVSRDTKAG